MDAIVSPVITPVVESLKKHLGFLVSSTDYVKDMKKKMEQLNVIGQDIQESGPVESHRKRKWLEDVKILNERSNLIEATRRFNVAKRYKIGKQSYCILKEIEDLQSQTSQILMQFTNDKKSLAASSSTLISVPHDTHKSFESRDLVFKDALKALQPNNESQKMIALCGMGGVGKTTMMEQLKKAVEDSKMFDWVVKVVIGESTDLISLQRAIAEYIREDLTETTKDARADRLRKIFEGMSQKGEKKVLVIMDDVWEEVDLKDVGLTSPLPNGFKLLFTSRFEYVCTHMGVRTNSIFRVGVLNYEEAKTLFSRVVGPSPLDGEDPELQQIGENIVKKCGGLPIAIITIGKILSDNIKEAWEKALWRLEKDDLTNLESITHRLFEMSYENLKEDGDKAIFLLSGLFPDDFDIRMEDLLRLPSTIGRLKKLKLLDLTGSVHLRIEDGVFENLCSLEELYMRANDYYSFMFTKANCDDLEILSHGLFALEFEFFENKAQPKNMSFTNLKRFRISMGCKLEKLVGKENVFRNTIQFVGDCSELLECKINYLFQKTEELRLQVNEMNHLEDVLMHHSFSNLTVLHVSKCTDLTYLFTVDVATGLKKLEQLTISECPVMRTLVAENSRVGVIKFQKLSVMHLISLPKMVSLWDNVIELPEIVELILDGLPNFTSICPQCNNTSKMQSLFNKKVLIPKLEKLNISSMENLNHIWSCETSDKSNVSMLRKISVRGCENLVNLFPNNPFPLLNHLEELVVDKCGSIEMLFNMEFKSVYGIGKYNTSKLRSIRVENLGKLKELWRMKGVNNGDIHINCFKGVESIEIINCSIFKNIFTPTIANFNLGALTHYIIKNINGKKNSILKGEMSNIEMDDERMMEVVFDMDGRRPLLLPYLKVLELRGLKEMTHVWKFNWNKFSHQPLQFLFQNLTKICLRDCNKIMYLFSPLMAKFLSNIKYLSLQTCDVIEEVVSCRDDESKYNTFVSFQRNTILFPCLETLELESLTLLNRVDDGDNRSRSDTVCSNITTDHKSQSGQVFGACWSLCQYPRNIYIYGCPALSSLIPWYVVGQMKKLEDLRITNCEMMMEVFESETSTNSVDEGSAHGGVGTFITSQTLKPLPLVVPQLANLKRVDIDKCDLVSHPQATQRVEGNKMQGFTSDCKEEIGTSSKDVVFPRLETLVLDDLPSLKGFFLGTNDFRWPSLDYVKINDCPELMMFTSGSSKTPKLKYIYTRLGKHSVECGLNFHGTINEFQTTFPSSLDLTILKGLPLSFHNLIQTNIDDDINGETIFPSHALPQLQKLEKIDLSGFSKVKEVFEVVALEGSDFNKSQTVVKIPNLTHVELELVFDLKYLWKSNPWMVLEFPNLTNVWIEYCNSLEHVFTCSMVASLVQLQDLQIGYCGNIEVIVKEEDEEKECHGKVNKIMLPRLKSLKLECLPSLKGFCLGKEDFSWPLLETLQINRCPAITVFTKGNFSVPKLKVIDTSFGRWYVKPDLNSFIKTKQEAGYEL